MNAMQTKYGIDEDGIGMENSRCPICGEGRSDVFLTASGIRQNCRKEYNLVRCSSCGFVYLNPRPAKGSISKYYLASDPEKTHRKPAPYEKFYFSFFRKVPLKDKGRLLDIGCGSGRYIYVLKENGWDVKGVDVGHTNYGRSVLGLDIYEGNFLDAGLQPKSFDAVTFWWTLEHMYDPLAMLKEAYRVLKKGGVAVIGVPNIDSLEAKIFKRHWFHLFLPKHLYQFSPDSLTKMLHKAGFKKVKIRHDLFSFGIIGSLECLMNSKGMKVSFKNVLFYILSLPLDMILGLIKNSGLITAYAFKE